MKRWQGWVVLLLVAGGLWAAGCTEPTGVAGASEKVIRHNIIGTAYLGQQKWTEAEAAFGRALAIAPEDPLLLNNAAVALVQQGRIDEAEAQLRRALEHDPQHPYSHYNLGLIEKNRGSFEEAVPHFETVAAHDPEDLLTQYNLGIVLSRTGRAEGAERAFRKALDKNPAHVSSLYGLGRFLLQRGDREEGSRMIALSQEIRARSGLDEAVGSQYGEQGPYAMGVDYPGDALPAPDAIAVRFDEAARLDGVSTSGTAPVAAVVPLGSAGPARLVIAAGRETQTLSMQPRVEIPAASGPIRGLAAGDVDGDETVELIALLSSEGRLWPAVAKLDDGGSFGWLDTVFSPQAAVATESEAGHVGLTVLDRDHDGDLDLAWCWTPANDADPAGCRVATNDGAGRFTVRASSEHGFEADPAMRGSVALTFSDIDNDRDIDMLIYGPWGVRLLTNQRDDTFAEISGASGLDSVRAQALGVHDMNKDGWMDLVVGDDTGVRLWLNRSGRFEDGGPIGEAGVPAESVVVLDFDNDGFLDVARSGGPAAPTVLRNLGRGAWEVAPELLQAAGAGARPWLAHDDDNDGDLDLVALDSSGSALLLSNEGGNANAWIAVETKGIGDNSFGIGSKVEILAGALRQKFELLTPLPLHVGLGERTQVESVRYLWPGGVLQDEVELQANTRTAVTQLDRKGTSCPLLYAWNDGRWSFVTDFLGGSAIGYQHAPGVFGTPDTDEYVKIEGGLEPDEDGSLRLRLNNQLEEVIWFDEVELLVVDHPAGTEVFPNERLMPGPPWPAFELFASSDIRPVTGARGVEDGQDLAARLQSADRRYVDNFDLLPFKGYAESHTIELDLGVFRSERVVLLLDGWIDYADSTSNIAAHQAGVTLVPPRLTIADGRGGWIATDHLMGFPAGLPKTMAVELTGLFPGPDHRVRIETNMRIYWDRARVLLGGEQIEPRIRRLEPLAAELRFGGFPQEADRAAGKPYAYDPDRVAPHSTWKAHVGAYTAFGEVRDLLLAIDDRFVTTRNGDEIELRFRAPEAVAEGSARTYLLFADGFGKDMDPNSAANAEVGPLPFHGMPSYPYPDTVVRPWTDAVDPQRPRLVLESTRGWPGALPQALVAEAAQTDAR